MSEGGNGQGGAFPLPKASDGNDESTKNEDARVAGTETTEATKNGEDQTSAVRADRIGVGSSEAATGNAGETSNKTPNQHQHASAALLLDLAASAKSAAADSNQEGHADKPAALTNRQTSDPTGGGGHANFHGGMPEQSLPTHSDGMLPPHTTPPHLQHDEMPPAAFPPRFDETGSPFVHAADYAAGMALRNNVLGPVLSELSLDGGKKVGEDALANLVDEFIRGKSVRLELSTGLSADKSRKKSTAVAQAQILPVSAKDASVIATWYSTHGDKALSYTSKAWSEWWIMRCGHPDIGCEMVKLVEHKNGKGSCDDRKEVILGIAYVERSVVDCYPIAVGDSVGSEELCDDNTESDMMPRKKRRRDDSGGGSANSRMIQTTLIRGLRINPKYNPEVARRLDSISKKDTSSAMHESYAGIPAALVVHVLAQSLRFGTEAVGLHCPKVDAAEAFFRGLFQGSNQSEDRTSDSDVLEDEDGRKYFRLLRNNRWEVLRAAIVQQVRLSE